MICIAGCVNLHRQTDMFLSPQTKADHEEHSVGRNPDVRLYINETNRSLVLDIDQHVALAIYYNESTKTNLKTVLSEIPPKLPGCKNAVECKQR